MGVFGLSCKEQLSAGSETLRDSCERNVEVPVSTDDWTSHSIRPSWSLHFAGSRKLAHLGAWNSIHSKISNQSLTIRKDDPRRRSLIKESLKNLSKPNF